MTSATESHLLPPWQTYLLAFSASACTLIIELVAGRIMAPLIGVSLYTWTSIIGVVLAGISLGNFLGGKLADRFASRRLLGLLFVVSGLAGLSILYTATAFASYRGPSSFPLVLKIVTFTAALFFVPSCVLGTISPLLVKLTLCDLSQSGNAVGKIYAVSTAGSIFGTFATGFHLISRFGTRTVVLGVGLACFLLAVLAGDWSWRGRGGRVGAGLLLAVGLGIGDWGLSSDVLKSDCLRETNYYCIKVHDQESNGEPVKVLVLDHLVHSYNSLEKPEKLTYGYEYVYAALAEYLARQPQSGSGAGRPEAALSSLFIGGGGYTFPRYLEARYPNSVIDVMEIDPEVTEVAIERLGVNPAGQIRTINLDARLAIEEMPADQKYDLVLGDAFHGYSVPYHLTTKEFNDAVRAHMTERGIYMLNIIDGRTGVFARSISRTMRATFPYVAAIPIIENYADYMRGLWVIVGAQQPIERASYLAAAEITPRADIAAHLWDGAKLDEFLASGYSVVITDDYAPVDNLLAPVFEESGFD
jgi:predicted membrane-bound spermidine synthase